MSNIAPRKFGIEIECIGADRSVVIEAIRAAGVECHNEGYNHTTRAHWKTVSDASVSGGFELVSPPLIGVEGLNEVRKVARAMASVQGLRVDRRCGLHVHVDAADLTVADMLNICKRYSNFEDKIDHVMPQSRRANNNTYCMSMSTFLTAYGNNPSRYANPRALASAIHSRYYKVNLQAYLRHNTVEFRQHSGTTNATKIINWIVFCVTLVETSKQARTMPVQAVANVVTAPVMRAVTEPDPRDVVLTQAAATRFRAMLEAFLRGATIEGAASASGMSAATVRGYLNTRVRNMGYQVRTNRSTQVVTISVPAGNTVGRVRVGSRSESRRPTRDAVRRAAELARQAAPQPQAQPIPAPRPAPVDVTTQDPFRALEPDVLGYFAERAQDFGFTFEE